MEIQAALSHLDLNGVPPLDVLEELVEEKCFGIRDYFLRNGVIPELYHSRIQRLERIAEAANALGISYAVDSDHHQRPFQPDTSSLPSLLQSFEERQASTRLKLSATLDPRSLISIAQGMVADQAVFEEAFFQLTAEFGVLEEAVKAAHHLDTGHLLRWMAENGVPNHQDKNEAVDMIETERRRISDRRERMHRR